MRIMKSNKILLSIGFNSIFLLSASYAFHTLSTPVTATRWNINQLTSTSASMSTSNNENENDKEKKSNGTINPFRLAVLKLGFTEPAWTSPLNYETRSGTYICANCKTPLFDSQGKYDSKSGWPSFYKTYESNALSYHQEWDGRMECRCQNCGGHLGHVFMDGPKRNSLEDDELESIPKSDPRARVGFPGERLPRFCINGAAMNFNPNEEL